jgi:hypothetical protein
MYKQSASEWCFTKLIGYGHDSLFFTYDINVGIETDIRYAFCFKHMDITVFNCDQLNKYNDFLIELASTMPNLSDTAHKILADERLNLSERSGVTFQPRRSIYHS